MASSYDITTDAGRVRLLISDVGGSDGSSFVFNNDEIDSFLEMAGTVDGAAARALRTIAGNEAMVSKRIKFLELSTDGPAVAKALLDLAEKLDPDPEDDYMPEIASFDVDPFTHRYIGRTSPELAE